MRLHIIIYTLLLALPLSIYGQSDKTISRGAVRFVPGSSLLQTNPATGMSWQSSGSPFITSHIEEPSLAMMTSGAPSSADVADTTKLADRHGSPVGKNHAGDKSRPVGELHGSVGLSVMAGFGKGALKGAGFAQNFDINYTMPLGRHGWLMAGGYIDHLTWGGVNATSGGFYGELGYQFDDHWAAYVYGQKSIVNSGMGGSYGYPGYYGYMGYPGYGGFGYSGYNPWGDKLGAALRWTPNRSFSMEISVEKNWMPRQQHQYFDQYNYPVPKR